MITESNKSPTVSVIISTKNEEKNILNCLQSIENQNYSGEVEIIVVDNHSKDKTAKLVTSLVSKLIIAGPERSKQRNIGAKNSTGKWLVFLDADMEISSNLIKECVTLTTKSLYPPMIVIPEQSQGHSFWGKALALERNCYKGPSWLLAARFFPKSTFLKLKGYDQNLSAGEDWDLTQRMQEKGVPMLMVKNSVIYHHESTDPLFKLFKKEAYYIKYISSYARKHPIAFSYQGSFFYRGFIWIRSWRELIKHPILTPAFLWYKFIVWLMWQKYKKV